MDKYSLISWRVGIVYLNMSGSWFRQNYDNSLGRVDIECYLHNSFEK